ncbi:MAG: glycosyltransferase family 2 protein [Actinomycetales bacterium]|nr:glycosyltransferase family 2 protein [Actinomycetales bacterium]
MSKLPVRHPELSPGVSVVIPHYGDPAPTLDLLAQLADQAAPLDSTTGDELPIQLIVSDDASPQPFPEEGTAYRVVVVRRERNGGFGAAVNSGVAEAVHDQLLILNSDLQVGPTFVRDLVAAAAPWQPAVVGPAILEGGGASPPETTAVDYSGRHFPTAGHQVTEWLTPLAGWRAHRVLHEAVGHDTTARLGVTRPVDWLVGAALLLPTHAFRAVGGFDEGYFMNSEEVDLQRVLRRHGIPAVYAGTVTVTHAGGGSSDPAKRRAWVVQSRLRYAHKWGGRAATRRLQSALAAATAVNLVWNTGRRLAGRPVTPLATARTEWQLLSGRTPR